MFLSDCLKMVKGSDYHGKIKVNCNYLYGPMAAGALAEWMIWRVIVEAIFATENFLQCGDR
ncbi:hypothetical protein PRIPAC_93158 [Pristionchus pacificus]|uniref:Uncharacterized protein n=1 Tax=Pristionchus pacificus TaxID=54126 RepID=A0A2A6BIS3_PRIPA|nr:hypothetical protein PRIPAC_93158 [Pristionchus pacificus]|eukprot:PDM65728.1 hypothetical protein PRIPAC_45642 [Pristionchus pacificus]